MLIQPTNAREREQRARATRLRKRVRDAKRSVEGTKLLTPSNLKDATRG